MSEQQGRTAVLEEKIHRNTSKGNDLSTLLESRLAKQDHRIEQLEQKISDVIMFNRYLE